MLETEFEQLSRISTFWVLAIKNEDNRASPCRLGSIKIIDSCEYSLYRSSRRGSRSWLKDGFLMISSPRPMSGYERCHNMHAITPEV